MASQLGAFPRAAAIPHRIPNGRLGRSAARLIHFKLRAAVNDGGGGGSYLDMWKKATEREKKTAEFQKLIEKSAEARNGGDSDGVRYEELETKSDEFQKILEVSREERDRVQRLQVVDRAAAAISAARAVLKERGPLKEADSGELGLSRVGDSGDGSREGKKSWTKVVTLSDPSRNGIPGPDFWSWAPPPESFYTTPIDLQTATKASPGPNPTIPVAEKERSIEFLSLPFETKLTAARYPPLPPLQSIMELQKIQDPESITTETQTQTQTQTQKEEDELGLQSSANAAEAVRALQVGDDEVAPCGVTEDGIRWWRETGLERRPDGVLCRWTVVRGVSADRAVEWQEKFWEASDDFGYKELGSEKSGRDASGSVWREFWRESMGQERGLLFMEKIADKWGKNGNGDEWQEQWWERYNASGEAEKSAHKWCSIDLNTELEPGHAHIWHERWGEKYDGYGGSTKYTDKWAERSEGDDGWSKWGDKWDENFDPNSNGVKQGETWWEGKSGERWNRTWGENHNGSGWVQKYGKSSCGEHWDTHVEQETWYERFPHFGFYHCFENSVQLREVPKPSDMS